MSDRVARASGFALVGVLVGAIAIGLGLIAYADPMPEYTDPARAVEIASRSGCYTSECAAHWNADMDAVRTAKWLYFDIGRNMAAASFTLLILIVAWRPWQARRFANARTPRSRIAVLWVTGVAWLALIPAGSQVLSEELRRGYLPWWADSIGIPLVSLSLFVSCSLPIVIFAIWFLVLRRARLPVGLWYWDRGQPRRSAIWTFVYGTLVSMLLLLSFDSATGIDFLQIPINISLIYICLCCRAAVLSRPGWFGVKPAAPLL